MGFLSDLSSTLAAAGARGMGDFAAAERMQNKAALQQLFEQTRSAMPNGGMATPADDEIGQLIARVAPETQPSQLQQYHALLSRAAEIDPDKYGGAALESMSPDALLDYQQKQMMMDNMKAALDGGGNPMRAMVIGSGNPSAIATLYASDMEQGAKARQRQAVSSALGQPGLPQQTQNFNPAIPTATPGMRPDVGDIISSANPLLGQNVGIQLDGNMGAKNESLPLPLPQTINQQAQQVVAGQQPMATAPVVTPTAEPPVAQTPTASAQPTEVLLSPEEWKNSTPEGRTALALELAGQEGALKEGYDTYAAGVKLQSDLDKNSGMQTDAQKMQAGRTKFSSLLKDMVNVYDVMSKRGTVPSAQDNWFSRGLTALSQPVTDPQSVQEIEAYRQQLRLALIEASGLSSKVFDSNNEMQSIMNALTSPNQTIEATKNIIASLDKRYGDGELAKTLENSEQGRPATYMWTPSGGLQRK